MKKKMDDEFSDLPLLDWCFQKEWVINGLVLPFNGLLLVALVTNNTNNTRYNGAEDDSIQWIQYICSNNNDT